MDPTKYLTQLLALNPTELWIDPDFRLKSCWSLDRPNFQLSTSIHVRLNFCLDSQDSETNCLRF